MDHTFFGCNKMNIVQTDVLQRIVTDHNSYFNGLTISTLTLCFLSCLSLYLFLTVATTASTIGADVLKPPPPSWASKLTLDKSSSGLKKYQYYKSKF